MMKPKALIILANGTNRDGDAARAFELAGAEPVIYPIKQLRQSSQSWCEYNILVIAGGFSYADALGAGKLLSLDLTHYFTDQASEFIQKGRPVIGICNGFQALVKAGLLPGVTAGDEIAATLTYNRSSHFECRWVTLRPISQRCIWTHQLEGLLDCPVAHGEGYFYIPDEQQIAEFKLRDQIALVYTHRDGSPAEGKYPSNPNGSVLDIAGICNPLGNVLGLMPHPEDHVFPYQDPQRTRKGLHSCLPLFRNGVEYAGKI